MNRNEIVPKAQWRAQRLQLLAAEKNAMRQLDEVTRLRREMPWVRLESDYVFDAEDGEQRLSDLFGPHSQLILYHFMYGPDWDEGCLGCSFVCDHFDGANLHLSNHDVSLVCVSRAELDTFLPFKQRMGWKFPWVSSANNAFNFDFGVSFTQEQIASGDALYNCETTAPFMEEMQGLSVFTKDNSDVIYHTYSTYARGLDLLIGAHNLLDLTPKGRNEQGVMSWVRHHDRYGVDDAASFSAEESAAHEPVAREPAAHKRSENDCCCTGEESA